MPGTSDVCESKAVKKKRAILVEGASRELGWVSTISLRLILSRHSFYSHGSIFCRES